MWYAVLRDRSDNDWGYGSEIRRKAESMAVSMGPDAYLAVIDTEGEPVCVKEIERRDFSIRKEYAIINHNVEDAPGNNEDVLFESQDPEEIIRKLKELEEGKNDMTGYSIEEYTVDKDGDFFEGSDFDTVSNFCKRIAAARPSKSSAG